MRAPGLQEPRAVFDVDGTGSYGGGGDYGGNSYDSGGGGGSSDTSSSAATAAAADPGGTFGPDGGAEGSDTWGQSGFESSGRSDVSTLDNLDGFDGGDTRSTLDKIADLLFGTPTENRVANAYLSALSMAVPGMGLGMAMADRARAAGWDVAEDYATAEAPSGQSGPYGASGARTVYAGGPYAQSALRPSDAAPDPLPGFLPDGSASPGPYRADSATLDAAAAPGGALPGSAGTSASGTTIAGLPVGLLATAALVAAVAFG